MFRFMSVDCLCSFHKKKPNKQFRLREAFPLIISIKLVKYYVILSYIDMIDNASYYGTLFRQNEYGQNCHISD